MAALTTPIIRSDMRLYPGMPVKRINVRAVRGGKQKVAERTAGARKPRERQDSTLSTLSAHSAFDVTHTTPAAGSSGSLSRPGPLSVSSSYLSQRRTSGRKVMTEEQKRKRATSCMNAIPEEAEPATTLPAAGAPNPAFQRRRTGGGSIRSFFRKLGLGKKPAPDEDRKTSAPGALDSTKTWRNPSTEALAGPASSGEES